MTKRGVYRVLVTRVITEVATIELKASSRDEAEVCALISAQGDSHDWTETDEPDYLIEAVKEPRAHLDHAYALNAEKRRAERR